MFDCVTTSTTSSYNYQQQQQPQRPFDSIPSLNMNLNTNMMYQQTNNQQQLPQFQQQFNQQQQQEVVFNLDDFSSPNDFYNFPPVNPDMSGNLNMNMIAQAHHHHQQTSQPAQHQQHQYHQQQQAQATSGYYQCSFGDHATTGGGGGGGGDDVTSTYQYQPDYTNLDSIEPSLIATSRELDVLESRYQHQDHHQQQQQQQHNQKLMLNSCDNSMIAQQQRGGLGATLNQLMMVPPLLPVERLQHKFKTSGGASTTINTTSNAGNISINVGSNAKHTNNAINNNAINSTNANNSQNNNSAGNLSTYYQFYQHSSPTGSTHTSSGSTDLSEDTDEMFGFTPAYKQKATHDHDLNRSSSKNKRQTKKRKPKRDPNEPQKPVSAYALFFRDTQATIKGKSPNASFGEVSKIVASMWDSLDVEAKSTYKQKTETAKKDYLKQLATYRANLLARSGGQANGVDPFAVEASFVVPPSSQSSRRSSAAHQTVADSTTSTTAPGGSESSGLGGASMAGVGQKSLASLIAEPAPQQMLTATTTLTVPQSYNSTNRNKIEYELDSSGDYSNTNLCQHSGCTKQAIESQQWDRNYCSNECVVKHCRDVFGVWVSNRQSTENGSGTYAPV